MDGLLDGWMDGKIDMCVYALSRNRFKEFVLSAVVYS